MFVRLNVRRKSNNFSVVDSRKSFIVLFVFFDGKDMNCRRIKSGNEVMKFFHPCVFTWINE